MVKLTAAAELADAGIAHATAIICVGDDDAINLEIALLARKSNPARAGRRAAGQQRAA